MADFRVGTAILFLAACSVSEQPDPAVWRIAEPAACEDAGMIGRFDPATDLFLPQFDIKTDTDDIQAAAAVGTILRSPDFACVRAHAVHGAYGEQGGEFIPVPAYFDRVFGDAWSNAHAEREDAAGAVTSLALATLENGGDVWVMEAGQSDFSASVVENLLQHLDEPVIKARFHIVQHSNWNEESTTDDALEYVRAWADYIRIPDGNAAGNGSPGFAIPEQALWPRFLDDSAVGPLWAEAKERSEHHNGEGYLNPMIDRGGFDFSDTVEAAYIFGFDDMDGVEDFADRFLTHASGASRGAE